METGNSATLPSIEPTLIIEADLKYRESSDIFKLRSVCHLKRNGAIISNFADDLLTLVDYKAYEFPFSLIDSSWKTHIDSILATENLSSTIFLIEPKAFCLIPSTLFKEVDIMKYFYNVGIQVDIDSMAIRNHDLGNGTVLVSLLPKFAEQIAQPEAIFPDLYPIINSIVKYSQDGLTQIVIRHEQIDLAIFGSEGPILLNRFSADHPNDILYFTVAAAEQTGLNLDTMEVLLLGEDQKTETVRELFTRYFQNLTRLTIPEKLTTPYGFKDVKLANCWATLNAHLCV